MLDLDLDACAARRCKRSSEGTYYGIPLCDSHWSLICTLLPEMGAVQAIRNLLPREARGLVLVPAPREEEESP